MKCSENYKINYNSLFSPLMQLFNKQIKQYLFRILTNSVPQNSQKFLKSLWQSENVFFIVLFWEFYYKKSNFQAYFPSQPSL